MNRVREEEIRFKLEADNLIKQQEEARITELRLVEERRIRVEEERIRYV